MLIINLTFISCDPDISITSPKDGASIVQGTQTTISVEVKTEVKEVRFYIDGVGKTTISSFPYNYEWNTSNESIGSHKIKVQAFQIVGESYESEITVNLTSTNTTDGPVANFTVNKTNVAVNESVNFTDQSNSPANWSWDFGDGNKSSSQHPSHTYKTAGTYTVSLTVSNNNGSDTKTNTNYILVGTQTPTQTEYTDPRDGQIYKTIQIGNQLWMAENLNYNVGSGSWAYDNNNSNATNYGRLYDWKTACNSCPSGWKLPTDEEWTILTNYLGGEIISGGKLKEHGTSHWDTPNTIGGVKETGFKALPGGFREADGTYRNIRRNGNFWSSTESHNSTAWFRELTSGSSNVNRNIARKDYAFSVRCVKGIDNTKPIADFTAMQSAVNQGENIDFKDRSSYFPENWSWDFGDGSRSTEQNPSHVYSVAGTYTVSLTVSNSKGSNTKTITNYIHVKEKEIAYSYFTDSRDGQRYKTVRIGTQTWMAENLNYNVSPGSWVYDNNPSNAAIYGRLYNWNTAKKVCPPGWHLPSDAEWNILITYLRTKGAPGNQMKEAGTSNWLAPNDGATNSSGFSALPGGDCNYKGQFFRKGNSAYFWSSSSGNLDHAWYRCLDNTSNSVSQDQQYIGQGYSIRCVKDY